MHAESPLNWHTDAVFGLHFDLHARSWETQHGRDLTAAELGELIDVVKPEFVQCDSKGHDGYTTWPTKVGTTGRDLAKDSLRIYRDATAERGLPLVIHYSGVWDAAAILAHPDWAAIDSEGKASTMATCRLSGYDEDLMIPQLREIIREYDVDGIWVDGENWAAENCYCPRCEVRFRELHQFSGPLPRSAEDPTWPSWQTFHRDLFRVHVQRYRDEVKAAKPSCTVISNWAYSLRQPERPPDGTDYLSGDFDCRFGSEVALPEAAFLDTQSSDWDLMIWAFTMAGPLNGGPTLKSAYALCQEAALILSRGGTVVLYDQPARHGRHVPWHTPVLSAVGEFCREREELTKGRSANDVLVLLNTEEHYRASTKLFEYNALTESVQGAAFVLNEIHRPCDIRRYSPSDHADQDWSQYRYVVVPEQRRAPDLLERLRDFAQAGGIVLLTGSEWATQDLGLLVVEDAPPSEWIYVEASPGTTTALPGPWPALANASATGDLVVGGREEFDPNSESAQTVLGRSWKVGSGEITVVGGPLFRGYYATRYPRTRQFVESLLRPQSGQITTNAPSWVSITQRTSERGRTIHLLNTATGHPLSASNAYVEAGPPARNFTVTVPVDAPPRGFRVIPEGAQIKVSASESGSAVRLQVEELTIHAAVELLTADQP